MLKPDALQRGLVGEIIGRFERRGFTLRGARALQASRELIESHYAEHIGKTYYCEMIEFVCSGPVMAMIWDGNIVVARALVGATLPWECCIGTIRGDLSSSLPKNLVHVSADAESARREVDLWAPLL